jgi:hypothetical protein
MPDSKSTQESLRALLGPHAAVGNPVDMLASAAPEHYEQGLRLVLADDNIDSVLVELPELGELDLNPVLVSKRGVVVVGAKVRLHSLRAMPPVDHDGRCRRQPK